ncbi:hypothetical protein YC2023_000360 [Brassica napus]
MDTGNNIETVEEGKRRRPPRVRSTHDSKTRVKPETTTSSGKIGEDHPNKEVFIETKRNRIVFSEKTVFNRFKELRPSEAEIESQWRSEGLESTI